MSGKHVAEATEETRRAEVQAYGVAQMYRAFGRTPSPGRGRHRVWTFADLARSFVGGLSSQGLLR